MELIELNVPVERNADGYWWNPGMPDFDEEVLAYKRWLDAQHIETTYKDLQDESDEHPAYIKYFDEGDPNISEWTPTPPDGEGWFTLCINAHEDGVCWVWARRRAGSLWKRDLS